MAEKKLDKRGKVIAMREITLPERLRRARDGRSYSEMARRCGLAVATVHRIETGTSDIPSRATLEALARGYRVSIDDLARAAYGLLFETDPAGADDTAPSENGSPPDSNAAWRHGTRQRHASALT